MQRITIGGCTAWCSGLLQQQGVVQRDAADYYRGLYSVMQRITTTTGVVQRDAADYYNNWGLYIVMQRITTTTGGCTAWCSGLLQQQGVVQLDAADYYNNRGLYSVMQRITTTTGGCTAWCSGLRQQQRVVQRDAADYYNNRQCSAQVFRRAVKRAPLARWTEEKGHNYRGERNKKGNY